MHCDFGEILHHLPVETSEHQDEIHLNKILFVILKESFMLALEVLQPRGCVRLDADSEGDQSGQYLGDNELPHAW
eukprot:5201021-Amphidinium_carterae.1